MTKFNSSLQTKPKSINIKPGEKFRHYKGGEYEIITIALQEDSLETLVIYRSLSDQTIWARPLNNWQENVQVNGKKINRFKKI